MAICERNFMATRLNVTFSVYRNVRIILPRIMSFIQFESGTEKEKIRQELRNAREELLKRAQQNAEARANREVSKKLSGDTDWIHPSVLEKIGDDTKKSKKSKKSEKKLKKDKKKKDKKRKKKKKKYSSSDSESTEEEIVKKKKRRRDSTESSSDSTNDEDEWIEKTVAEKPVVRDDWMTSGLLLQTYSKEKNDTKQKEKQSIDAYNPGESTRELNPHWKNGGTGLPTFQRPKDEDDYRPSDYKRTSSARSGNWRKKSETQMSSHSSSSARNPSKSRTPPPEIASSASSSESEHEERAIEKPEQSNFLTDQQMNELGAKLVKAEIMGNTEMATNLKQKLDKARELRNQIKNNPNKQNFVKPSTSKTREESEEHIILTTTDSKGVTRPLPNRSQPSDLYGGRKKSRKAETHVSGERVRYFPDDDRYDIKQMFEREKYTTASDSDAQFAEIAGKHKNPKDDLEDIFADKVRKGISDYDKDEKEKRRAIHEHEQFAKTLETCDRCFDSPKMEKQLIVSMGSTAYLALPWHEGLQPGHCVISSIQHTSCSTQLDEDTWSEINDFRKALTRMFASRSQDVIFFEIARYLNKRPHMTIHCIASKDFEMAPFYFKKAIQESEYMWSTNKQLVSLKDKDVRRAIPKGLPYFWVNFGMDSGFAHVIEDQERFPHNFAQEIIGGILNLDPKAWRKPRREYNPIPKVKQFADLWKQFDCTNK